MAVPNFHTPLIIVRGQSTRGYAVAPHPAAVPQLGTVVNVEVVAGDRIPHIGITVGLSAELGRIAAVVDVPIIWTTWARAIGSVVIWRRVALQCVNHNASLRTVPRGIGLVGDLQNNGMVATAGATSVPVKSVLGRSCLSDCLIIYPDPHRPKLWPPVDSGIQAHSAGARRRWRVSGKCSNVIAAR